jgi:hypothetical protein
MSNSLHRRLDAIELRIKAMSADSDTEVIRAFFHAANSEEGFDTITAKWPNHPMVQLFMADGPDKEDERNE